MLANKTKKAKNKQKKSTDNSEENLQSMRSWVRKIEQTTNSVSSRLSAVLGKAIHQIVQQLA